jgi:hypothetical protein
VNIWLIVKAAEIRDRHAKYVAAVDEHGNVEYVPHAVQARRFASAAIAREWASKHPTLEDHRVVRAP